MGAELAAAIAPWFVFGVAFCGILVYALRAGKKIARSSEDAEDANARADFNREMANRSVAASLKELADRARRRRERL